MLQTDIEHISHLYTEFSEGANIHMIEHVLLESIVQVCNPPGLLLLRNDKAHHPQ